MSIWSTIGGIAAGIGTGIIAGPAAGIAVGSSIIGSGIQSDQVSKATKKQDEATKQALQVGQDVYADTRKNFDPYLQLGSGAVGNLRGLTGLGPAAPMGPVAGVPQAAPTAPAATDPATIGHFQSMLNQASSQNAPTDTGYVVMAKDGVTKHVPTAQVDYWLANGAQKVSA